MKDFPFNKLRAFLESHGITPGVTLEHTKFFPMLEAAQEVGGDDLQAWIMDCFMPEGEPIEPGYEESMSHYYFCPESWEELQADWEKES